MRICVQSTLLVTFLACIALSAAADFRDWSEVNNNVTITQTAIAGLSSGAFLTVQYHVAFSSSLVGAVVIAGGPYYCAADSLDKAELDCMSMPMNIDVQSCISAAKSCESSNDCDATSNLKSHNVWLFSGTADTVVKQGVMDKLVTFYEAFMSDDQINKVFNMSAEHSWPTVSYGNDCTTLKTPFINKCNFDAAYIGLSHVFQNLNPPTTASSSNVFKISQADYTPDNVPPASLSLGPDAYVYAPQACVTGTPCRMVIAVHGCQQTVDDIGTDFVMNIGMNEVAEANNIVVLYPQACRSEFPNPLNPEGCFDWYGITGSSYASKKGPQMATIYNMASNISGRTATK